MVCHIPLSYVLVVGILKLVESGIIAVENAELVSAGDAVADSSNEDGIEEDGGFESELAVGIDDVLLETVMIAVDVGLEL